MKNNSDDALSSHDITISHPRDFASSSPLDSSSRNDIRRRMRLRRRALSRAEARQAASDLAQRLGNSALFLRSEHIAFYLANDGEMDLMPLIERAWAMGKHCYLPVLSPAFHNRLWFARYRPETPLTPNRFGIPEPAIRWREARPASSIDLMLTPLVAFDRAGNRLGMGGGFYDRTLAYLLGRGHWRKPELIGIAYDFQNLERLPHAAWDVPLHGVATDHALYRFPSEQ